MNPLQILLGGLAFIGVFLVIALPMGWLGTKLYAFLEDRDTDGVFLSIAHPSLFKVKAIILKFNVFSHI